MNFSKTGKEFFANAEFLFGDVANMESIDQLYERFKKLSSVFGDEDDNGYGFIEKLYKNKDILKDLESSVKLKDDGTYIWDIKEEVQKYRGWENKHTYKYLLIYCVNGKEPVKVYCTWHDGASSHEGVYFSCKEAAEQWLKGLKRYRERRIERAKNLIEKETKILSKYKFND